MTLGLSQRNTGLTSLALPDIFQLAEMLIPTGFLPESIKTPGQAAAIIIKGQELGVPPLYALNNISIIKGKQVCQAELMLTLIYRDQGDQAVKILETNDRVCRVRYKRRGGDPGELAFTIEEATQAGLVARNPTYKQYPAAMLRARAISAAARIAFPDSIAGMYTPDELGARVVVNEQGEVILDSEQDDEPAPASAPPRRVLSLDGESIRPQNGDRRGRLAARFKELVSTAIERRIELPDLPAVDSMSEQELEGAGRELAALVAADDAGRR